MGGGVADHVRVIRGLRPESAFHSKGRPRARAPLRHGSSSDATGMSFRQEAPEAEPNGRAQVEVTPREPLQCVGYVWREPATAHGTPLAWMHPDPYQEGRGHDLEAAL